MATLVLVNGVLFSMMMLLAIFISLHLKSADGWMVNHQSYGSSSSSSSLSRYFVPPSPSFGCGYCKKRNRISLSVLSSATQNDEMPMLRSLYDAPPPQLSANDDKIGEEIESSDSKWITNVTSGMLSTESQHELYYEVHRRHLRYNEDISDSDNTQRSKRLNALFLHGGPGAGCYPNHIRFFSPELYDTVILVDQRGCGRSTPLGEVVNNTLELLVNDVEQLRLHILSEDKPYDAILGGSWGCTLALAYAHTYPQYVRAMVLRGVCLFRPQEIDWLFGDPKGSDLRPTSNLRSLIGSGNGATQIMGERTTSMPRTASHLFPKGWQDFVKGSNIAKVRQAEETHSSINSSRSILHRYYNLILGSDPNIRFTAVKSWIRWEMGIYSSGFSGSQDKSNTKNQSKEKKNDNNDVLVWNPSTELWAYEDARVWNNASCVSINIQSKKVDEVEVQSLRRYSSLSPTEPTTLLERAVAEQMSILPVIASSQTIATPVKSSDNNNNTNSTSLDPTTYIPAQPMLTCYYSTNDNYCIGSYRPFMSLSPPPYIPLSAWYSSKLPPQIVSRSTCWPSATGTFPLPPTIAIQGGNDAICPPDTALDLHNVWKDMELRIVLNGGHSMYNPGITGEIIKALDRFGHALINVGEV